MKLIVWNSQGAKWDDFWNKCLDYYLKPSQDEDVVGLLVEAGWAPWQKSGNVKVNNLYTAGTIYEYFDEKAATQSILCQQILSKDFRVTRLGYWIPWVETLGEINNSAATNSRCSIGAVTLRKVCNFKVSRTTTPFNGTIALRRSILRIFVKHPKGRDIEVFLVHLLSGNYQKAWDLELKPLILNIPRQIQSGSAALIVGDMNIDLNKYDISGAVKRDYPHWRVLNTGDSTQQKGGELDFGLLYDPKSQHTAASAATHLKYGKDVSQSGSDHSVIEYDFPSLK